MAAQDLGPSLVLPGDKRWPLSPDARRVEIDEFIADEPMTNLFLLALSDLMKNNLKATDHADEDWFSFYNLAAIHGYPNELWRGVPNTRGTDQANGFYCTHSSNVFPTWHRLYIHMYEQAIFRHMQRIAGEFEDVDLKAAHQAALKRFRFPYWDPCLPRNELTPGQKIGDMWDVPLLLKSDNVWIITPQGLPKQILNPLLSYKYPPQEQYVHSGRTPINWTDTSQEADSIYKIKDPGRSVTVRSPLEDGASSHVRFQETLQNQYSQLSVNLFQLLHPNSVGGNVPWPVFANNSSAEAAGAVEKAAISLESWHDKIHGVVGSGANGTVGHMASLSVASFDPVFWLHHNNVDRIFALYQAMYEHEPNKYVADVDGNDNAFTASTPLSPFVKYQKGNIMSFYDSNDVKDWTGLGYAVPGNKHLTTTTGRNAVAKYIMEVYQWSSDTVRPKETLGFPRKVDAFFALSGSEFDLIAEKDIEFLAIENDKIVRKTYESSGKLKSVIPMDVEFRLSDGQIPDNCLSGEQNAQTHTWSVLINVNKYAFNSTFFVQFFIGRGKEPLSDKGGDYMKDLALAGSATVFAFSQESDCQHCRSHANMIYTDTISLTAKLREFLQNSQASEASWPPKERRTLKSLEIEDVKNFLAQEFEWRVVQTDGQVATPAEVKASGLKLLVAESLYTYPTKDNNVGPLGEYRSWIFLSDLINDVGKGRINDVAG